MSFHNINLAELASRITKKAGGNGESLTVEITDITPEQKEMFIRMFAWMNFLGGAGASREFTVSYDGDGGARATIKVDGKRIEVSEDEKDENPDYDDMHFGFE